MLSTVRTDLRKFWNNGTRALMIAFFAFLASAFLLAAVGIFALYGPHKGQGELPVTMDFRVHSPTVTYGDGLLFTAEYCNHTDDPVRINRTVVMTKISTDPPRNVLYYNGIGLDVEPGCLREPITEAPLPPDVDAGTWRITHYVFTDPPSGEKRKVIVPEPEFTVVEAGRP